MLKGLFKEEEKQKKEREKEKENKEKQSNDKMALHIYVSITTLNVNSLNATTKRQRVAEWIRKQDSYIFCLQKTYLRSKLD